MNTYLLVWNPNRWAWADLDAQIEQVGLTGQADDRWSSGNRKELAPGSRFFLIRLGAEPKGIMGSGLTLGTPKYSEHWDPERAAKGEKTLYVDIRFDCLGREVLVTWEELHQPPLSSYNWSPQVSGLTIPEPIAGELEKTWQRKNGGVASSPTFPSLYEGARRRVMVNAYERNPIARTACLAHHGCRCKVCDVDLGERYGEIAHGFIHVHHLVPVSSIGQAYAVNPITDLVPVCPTCHAILHLRNPPLSIEAVRLTMKDNPSGMAG